MSEKPSILFLCTGNSCRSQMAEGFCRHLHGDLFDVASAGIESHGLNAGAVKVMMELGIDISHHRSKTIEDLGDCQFDYVVTVCDHAHETCPYFPATTATMHKGFDDPPKLPGNSAGKEAALKHYRRVRDQIREFVQGFPDAINVKK